MKLFAIILGCSLLGFSPQTPAQSKAKRDLKAEDAVFARFNSLRTQTKLPLYKRGNGASYTEAACKQADENDTRESSYQVSNRAVFYYTTSDPEASDTLNYVATRRWKHVRHFTVGVCHSKTKEHPEGLYFVLIGLTGNEWDKFSADMLSHTPSK